MMTRRQLAHAALLAGLAANTRANAKDKPPVSDLEQLHKDLAGWSAIDNHRTGTTGDTRTAEWLAAQVQAAGLTPQLETFPFHRRTPTLAQATCNETTLTGVPLFDGGTTPTTGISGVCGELGSNAPIAVTPFEPFAGHPTTRALNLARRDNSHAAIIAYCGAQTSQPGLSVLNAPRYTRPGGPAVLQVSSTHGEVLRQALAEGQRMTVKVTFNEESVPASNVTARIQGQRPELAPIVVMTPRSGWWTCAAERGGGIATWLASLRHFAQNPPARGLWFLASTGHELGHIGLEHFLADHDAQLKDIAAWIHLGANFIARDGLLRLQASDDEFMTLARRELTASNIAPGDVVPVDQRPRGEAANIFERGGRYISILGNNPWFHHPDDVFPESIDFSAARAVTQAMTAILTQIANST